MTFLRTLLLSLALVIYASSAAWPQDFSKGFKAYRAGDYATALQEWRPLAEQEECDGLDLGSSRRANGRLYRAWWFNCAWISDRDDRRVIEC